jgi:ribosomal protein S18 acetylase RimI-like enzyme
LAARVDGKLAGFRFANFNPYLKEAYLMDLFVKPEYRRLGIGSKLYQKTFEILRKKECEWAWLLVKNSNKTMEQFLEKQGFVKGSNFNFFFKVKPF